MKPVFVNPIKFERMRRYVWRRVLDEYPTLIQIGNLHTGVHLSNIHIAKDNSELTGTLNFTAYSLKELELMTQKPLKAVMEFGDFPFEVVDIETRTGNRRFDNAAFVTIRVRVQNRAGRYSEFAHNFLKRFMG